jgi:hypothetical protein
MPKRNNPMIEIDRLTFQSDELAKAEQNHRLASVAELII